MSPSETFSIVDFIASPQTYVKTKSVTELIDFIELANEYYRNGNDTLIDDDLYDWLEEYTRKKDPQNAFFKKIGAPIENKELLPKWMGSLDKVRDDPKALESWVKKYKESPYVLSDKLDGNSGMFGISKKKQYALFTRGDGMYGRNISSYVKYFSDKFKSIDTIFDTIFAKDESQIKKEYPLLVRGELILSKKSWEMIKHKGSNARNVIAGTLNAKTPDEEIAKHIDFIAYELIEPKMLFFDGLQFLKSLGFNVVYHRFIDKSDINTESLTQSLMDRRNHSEYEIDGIVVRDNKVHKIVKNENPKYAFAYKTMLTHETVEVTVLKVNWNVSKDGLIKPVVQFAPVAINNVYIEKTTGFNGAFIEKNCIGVGSKLMIIRSGDVIPHITKVLTKATSGTPDMPTIPYIWTDTHVDVMIKKDEVNDQMNLKQMVHFASKLNITHVAEGTLKKMYANGIDSIPKLLKVKKADLLKIDGIQEKGAEKIFESIKTKFENTNCLSLMVASNIFGKGFGERKLKLFVEAHPEILEGKMITKLKDIDGIGDIMATQFLENLPTFYAFLKDIGFVCKKAAKLPTQQQQRSVPMIFENMTVVFTGFRNANWEKQIVEMGGKIGLAISKNTSLLVVSDTKETTKVIKARDLGVRVIDKINFVKEYNKYGFE